MFQILKKLLLVLLCLSLLSSFVFADDLTILEGEQFNTFGNLTAADYGVNSVSWAVTTRVRFINSGSTVRYENVALSDSTSSASFSSSSSLRFDSVRVITVTASIPAGTLVVNSSVPFFTNMTVTSSSAGVTITASGSSLTIVSDGSTSPITLRGEGYGNSTTLDMSASFTPPETGGGGETPDNPFAGTGSMFGWTGKTIFGLQTNQEQHWYIHNSGDQMVGHLDATYAYGDAGSVPGYWVQQDMIASLTVQKWQWKINPETGLPAFNVFETYQGTWSDMIYRTSVYNYFWGEKLWGNDVSGSWYGSISSDFSYLNFRVNQILDVLANDEDLAIKDATTPERNWVKDYFSGSGDKADSDKYDKLNSTGSAFKDAFAGAPDSSIADGFTAVNDNGYEFWSQGVSNDINGVSSSGATRAPAYFPPEQRIVDAYSENWAQIVGGYYD